MNLQRHNSIRHRRWFPVLAGLWGLACVAGISVLVAYSNSSVPGTRHVPTHAATAMGKHRLLMFVHPDCPCSHASIRQLEPIMTRFRSQIDCRIHFFRPLIEPDEWTHTRLWHTAQRIPGVKLVVDPDGAAARKFNVIGSGHTLLFNPVGKLKFSGGISAGRGHEGECLGSKAVTEFVSGGGKQLIHAPVFGCLLYPVLDDKTVKVTASSPARKS